MQNAGTSVNTNNAEITSFIGIHILIGIVQILIYKVCWSRELRFPSVADVMSINQYEQLRQYLHFLGNNAPNNDFFFFNWDSPIAGLNSHYEAWSYNKKKAQKRLQDTENLFTKNLQLKDVS